MKLVIFVLNDVSKLEGFLHDLKEKGIHGATIISSSGMARKLIENDDMKFIGSLKALFDNPRVESEVILMAVEDDQVAVVFKVIDESIGDLKEPNSGIAFTVPIDCVKGYKC